MASLYSNVASSAVLMGKNANYEKKGNYLDHKVLLLFFFF